ncbi:transposase [Microcella frigidaquae]|nr:transposase [Microcella frigidaquae]
MQGYNAQTAATTQQIVVAAEVTATTNDQPHFVPIAMAVSENLAEAGAGKVGTFVADAGYWTGANGTADVGAEVLIATRKPPWRQAERPDDHKITILAKVNRGELSQRQAGDILGVSYTWVRDMTKRYFGKDGPRQARTAQPEPDEWIPVIERLARGEISKRAATDELQVSAGRVNTMLAHVRGEAVDPEIARHAMDAKLATEAGTDAYRKRQHSIEPVFGNVKGNLGYRRFTRRGMTAVHAEWRLICSVHNLLKLRTATTA